MQGHEDVCRDVDFLGDEIVKGRIHWSDLGKGLIREQELREWIDNKSEKARRKRLNSNEH